jgi:hypothetical protein|uniref:Uncharacterized protein n=1 Tax=viral metagenome TaxID=1070528 RepID=A0A6C0IZ80_9ZZZZ
MSYLCEKCWVPFKTQKSLEYHKNKSNIDCNKWKNVIFTCINCNYVTKGIKNIELHINKCGSHSDCNIDTSNPVGKLSEKYNKLMIENKDLKKQLEELLNIRDKYKDIEKQLIIEKTKCKLYNNILENNTNIKIDDLVTETDNNINIINPTDALKIFIYENFENKPDFTLLHRDKEDNSKELCKEEKKKKKQKFRPIKTATEIIINDDIIEKQQHSNEELEQIVQKYTSLQPSIENINDVFKQYLTQIKENKNYTKILHSLQNDRFKIFKLCNLDDYKDLLANQIQELENVFRTKGYSDRKIQTIILKNLSPLETRLLFYSNYYKIELDTDEIEIVKEMLQIQNCEVNTYIPFDINNLTSKLMNYSIVLFPLDKLLEIYLSNRFGYHNIIFVPLPKNSSDDPYSFYILDNVSNQVKKWKMDCRLENLIADLKEKVLPYMVSLFRKLYFDIFNDNEFRSNYTNFCPLLQYDCEQLLSNIVKLFNQKEFSKNVKKIIKDKFVYNPNDNDKFNLLSDDPLQKKRLLDQEVDLVDVIRLLFTGISSQDAVDLLREKNLMI